MEGRNRNPSHSLRTQSPGPLHSFFFDHASHCRLCSLGFSLRFPPLSSISSQPTGSHYSKPSSFLTIVPLLFAYPPPEGRGYSSPVYCTRPGTHSRVRATAGLTSVWTGWALPKALRNERSQKRKRKRRFTKKAGATPFTNMAPDAGRGGGGASGSRQVRPRPACPAPRPIPDWSGSSAAARRPRRGATPGARHFRRVGAVGRGGRARASGRLGVDACGMLCRAAVATVWAEAARTARAPGPLP